MAHSALLKPFSPEFDHDVRAIRALAWSTLVGITILPTQACIVRWLPDTSPRIPRVFHKVFCSAIGLKPRIVGTPVKDSATLFVANHISWLDIPLIGSQVLGSFVARSDLAGWGMFGTLSNLQRTIYIQREKRSSAAQQSDEIADRLNAGQNVILFPEGTSSPGLRVLPFRSSLFSVAERAGADTLIQPVSIGYTHINDMPITRAARPKVAWIGDMDLLPHVWEAIGLGTIRATIMFHPAVRRGDMANRKDLARHCEAQVAQGLESINRHRLDRD